MIALGSDHVGYELKKEIKQYIYYYNNERIKSNLNKMSPIQYRTHFYNN